MSLFPRVVKSLVLTMQMLPRSFVVSLFPHGNDFQINVLCSLLLLVVLLLWHWPESAAGFLETLTEPTRGYKIALSDSFDNTLSKAIISGIECQWEDDGDDK